MFRTQHGLCNPDRAAANFRYRGAFPDTAAQQRAEQPDVRLVVAVAAAQAAIVTGMQTEAERIGAGVSVLQQVLE